MVARESYQIGYQLLGQTHVKKQLSNIMNRSILSHAYIFCGPSGVGKKGFALAYAEAMLNIENLSKLPSHITCSPKKNWYLHPDIHVFHPLTTKMDMELLRKKNISTLDDVYYNYVPSLKNNTDRLTEIYSMDYYKECISKYSHYHAYEGDRTVIILFDIEKMPSDTANTFLKLLEEPPLGVYFILTTNHVTSILPTILSRCQRIDFEYLSCQVLETALMERDGLDLEEAKLSAQFANGNYQIAKKYSSTTIKQEQDKILTFLRFVCTKNIVELHTFCEDMQRNMHIEEVKFYTDLLEQFIYDLFIFRETQNTEYIRHINLLEPIQSFCQKYPKANLEQALKELIWVKRLLKQNVQVRIIYMALSLNLWEHFRSFSSTKNTYSRIPALSLLTKYPQ